MNNYANSGAQAGVTHKEGSHFILAKISKVHCHTLEQQLPGVPGHFQSTQNDMFAMSRQYFKKEIRDKFDYLEEDKHQSFLQVDIIVFGGHSQPYKSTQNNNNPKFAIS